MWIARKYVAYIVYPGEESPNTEPCFVFEPASNKVSPAWGEVHSFEPDAQEAWLAALQKAKELNIEGSEVESDIELSVT